MLLHNPSALDRWGKIGEKKLSETFLGPEEESSPCTAHHQAPCWGHVSWGHSLGMQQDMLPQYHPILTAAPQGCFSTHLAWLKFFIYPPIHLRHSMSTTAAPL